MTEAISFEQWYSQGTYAPNVQERRAVTSTPIWMFDVMQPAGDYPDPPVHEMTIIQDRAKSKVVCNLGAGKFRHEPGGIAIVPCNSATDITVDNPHNIRLLGFKPEKLNGWVEADPSSIDLGHLHASSLQSPFVHQLLDRIWDAGSADTPVTALYADAALLMLWAELRKEAAAPMAALARGGLAPWQVRRCTEYLKDQCSDNVGLESLANLVGLSPYHFARAFKQSTGMPPHRYQLNLRIARAKVLLENTDAPVTEVAFDVGYESSQALARLFRREMGLSPSEYRRQHGGRSS
jgi:AraC family transcriptional regulator